MLIGICGGSGSGKTTLTQLVCERLGPGEAERISFDSYYHDLKDLSLAERSQVNFDHPDSLDADLLATHLDTLKAGHPVAVPSYDFNRHTRSGDVTVVNPAPYVLVEGILLCSFDQLVDRFDLLIYRKVDEATRFARRLARDVAQRGRSEESVRSAFASTVKPMHDRYVEPAADKCDVVLTGNDLDAAVETVVAEIHRRQLNPPEHRTTKPSAFTQVVEFPPTSSSFSSSR